MFKSLVGRILSQLTGIIAVQSVTHCLGGNRPQTALPGQFNPADTFKGIG
jgi:hypothetical protein